MGAFDAIAIGGGLAGSAFALALARRGARVAVVERMPAGRLKVCGDFLSTEAQTLLDHLGLDVGRLGATRVSTLRMATGRRSASAPLPFRAAGLSRLRLDETLLAMVADAGGEIVRGAGATALELAADGVRVRVGRRVLTAKVAALATGKHNLRAWPRAAGSMTGLKMMLSLSPAASRSLDDVVQLVGYRGGYVGACNVEDDQATVCWLMDPAAMKQAGRHWSRHLDVIAGQSDLVGDLLQGAKPLAERPAAVSAIPFGYTRRTVVAPNVFPVGDQLCVIPSYTGDGTSLALSSGIAAARAVGAGQTAGAFQAAFLARIRAQFSWARAVDLAFGHPLAQSLAVAGMAAVPRIATLIAEATRVRDVEAMVRTGG